jgi:F-type H+-transporting ATPase subunit b
VRKLAILVILGLFVAYCVLAHQSRTWYEVPDYEVLTLDILDGATESQWRSEAYASPRYERLAELAGRNYQLAEEVMVRGRTLAADTVLGREDLAAITAAGRRKVKVRDPAAIESFVGRGLRLRQDVRTTGGAVIGHAGEPVDKDFVDRYLAAQLQERLQRPAGHPNEIAVVGEGDVVGFNATVLMVILIFVGMTLALQELFWDPMVALIDRRQTEIREGTARLRENRTDAARLETERRDALRAMHQEFQDRLSQARTKSYEEADAILTEVRQDLQKKREQANRELTAALQSAEEELRAQIPALTEAIEKRFVESGAQPQD